MLSPDLLPGEAINLYEGDGNLLIGQGNVAETVPAMVRVWFDWNSGLRVEAAADRGPDRRPSRDDPIVVSLPDVSFHLDWIATWDLFGPGPMSVSGSLSHVVTGDETALLDHVEFGLVNMEKASLFKDAVDVQARGWSVRIDLVEDYDDRVAAIGAAGGGALTHHAVLRRADGSGFVWADAGEVLDAVRWVASFVTGTRVPVLFPTAVDSNGQVVLREWGNVRRSQFGGVLSWCGDFQRADAVRRLIPALLDASQDLSRRRRLAMALEFWLEAQLGSALETRLVAAVAGLELMAWEWLVAVAGRDPDHVDRKKTVEWRLRSTLRLIGAPADVPSHMTEVLAAWPGGDGPKAVTDLRHRVVHPKDLDALFDVSHSARHDVLRLATWYLELSLLRRLGYDGRYIARIAPLPIFAGEGDPVPWAADSQAR